MKWIGLFLRSVRHTTLRQLMRRLGYRVRRRGTVALCRLGHMPGWWYREPPPIDLRIPRLLYQSAAEEGETLPLEIDLAGTSFTLTEDTNWNATELDHGTRLEKLHLHYFDYLPRLDPSAAGRLILDWIESNRPFVPGYWLDSWNSYALSIRIVAWIRFLATTESAVSDAARSRIERSLARQIRFLCRNLETDIGGNHLIRNIRALLWGSAYFSGREAEGWELTAERLLERELDEQILADGMHFELSPAYHNQVFGDLLESYGLLRDGSLKRVLGDHLDEMARVTADTTHPDGLPSLFNDGGLHMAREPEVILDLYEALRKDRPTPRPLWRLEEAGYAGARQGGQFVMVDFGRIGPDHLPAHAHGDIFAFEWTIAGERLIVDAGVAEYHAGRLRALSRSTKMHNTLTLDDEDQAQFWASFRVGRRPDVEVRDWETLEAGFRLVGRHTGYSTMQGRPAHERSIRVLPHRIAVRDRVTGGAGQSAVARLLLHPEVIVEQRDDTTFLRRGDIVARLTASVPVRARDSSWMPDFGSTIPTRQLILSYGSAPCGGEFTLTAE